MSGCGRTRYRFYENAETLRHYTDKLEKAANSDRRLRNLVVDYINMKNGITTAAKDLFAPITAATDDQTKKQQDLTLKLDKKQIVLANSLHIDAQLQANERNQRVIDAIRENLVDIRKIAEIQQAYIDAIFEVEKRLTEGSKTLLDEVRASAKKVEAEVKFQGELSSDRLRDVRADLIEQGEKIDSLKEVVQTESSTTRTQMNKHSSALEEMHNTEMEKLKEMESKLSKSDVVELPSTIEKQGAVAPSTSAESAESPHDSADEEEVIDEEEEEEEKREYNNLSAVLLKTIPGHNETRLENELIKIALQEFKIKFVNARNKHLNALYKDKTKAVFEKEPRKTVLPYMKTLYRKKYGKEWDKAYAEGNADDPSTSTGEGYKRKSKKSKAQKLERLNLLLSSHQAGNSAGMKEFHALLNKLLKQKQISKSEYDIFIKQWPVS